MARNHRRQHVVALARRIYHALPFSPSTKLKLRRLVVPYIHASAELSEGASVLKALARVHEARGQLTWGGARELAFQRALRTIGAKSSELGPVSHVIALPFLATGGAERVALNFACAIRRANPRNSVLLVVADRPLVTDRIELPEGVMLLPLDSVFDEPVSYEHKQQLLEDIILAIRPHVFHNINSEVAWELILAKGSRLSRATRLFASIFAFQFTPNGQNKTGYAAYFLKPGLPHLEGLLTDNQRFVRDAIKEYALSPPEKNKLRYIYNPVRVDGSSLTPPLEARFEELAKREPGRRLKILWAGRMDEEKRIDLLSELIQRTDFADFDVFGQAVVGKESMLLSHSNVKYKGAFTSPVEMIRDMTYDAFVFTSRWEGMPNILLEVGALGLPVIAPTVGGVGELINENTGYPLPERPDVEAYLLALEKIRSNAGDAADRARQLQRLVESRHSWPAFGAAIETIPGYLKSAGQIVSCQEKV